MRKSNGRQPQWGVSTGLGWCAALMLLSGCIGNKLAPADVQAPDTTLGAVHVSPLNAVMAVGDTLSVGLTGQTVAGTPVTSFDSVQYVLQRITDTIRVRVSPAGLVTGRASSGSSPVLLDVYGFQGGGVRGDQAIVQVTATQVPGVSLSIQPTGTDSARLAVGSSKTITPVIKNVVTGQSVASPTLRYSYRAADAGKLGCYLPSVPAVGAVSSFQLSLLDCGGSGANVGTNRISAKAVGTAWVYAVATIYGTALSDSVQYTLTNPFSFTIAISTNNFGVKVGNSGALSPVGLAPSGTVTFQDNFPNGLGVTLAFTFDNPAAATATTPPSSVGGSTGNITALTVQGQTSQRRFFTPGTYTYTAVITGAAPPFTNATVSGQIIVQ